MFPGDEDVSFPKKKNKYKIQSDDDLSAKIWNACIKLDQAFKKVQFVMCRCKSKYSPIFPLVPSLNELHLFEGTV